MECHIASYDNTIAIPRSHSSGLLEWHEAYPHIQTAAPYSLLHTRSGIRKLTDRGTRLLLNDQSGLG